MSRVVLLACSERKRLSSDPLPAIERYDGPLFRVVRRAEQVGAGPSVTLILSAKFGLVGGYDPIPKYDQRMTRDRAAELRESVRESLGRAIAKTDIHDLFVAAGADYEPALADSWDLIPEQTSVHRATGSIGGMAGQLYDWLHGKPSAPDHAIKGTASLLGVTIRHTPAEVVEVARRLLISAANAARFQNWYVPVDDGRVAPKLLVSELSKLPVSRFRSADAVRVLRQLGVEVLRV